ncbi:hypothetical protein BRD15_04365 [Halobacteriales archaeon SW_6_65_15]|nr:MAG: hypothetical protein BRD15_04365 [Halobacteriales archaeon SW_6_65_15]
MRFTDVPLRRSIPAGALAYVVGYLATYLAVGPDLFSTVFVAGVGYPFVFGWLGGWIARMRGNAAETTESPEPGA